MVPQQHRGQLLEALNLGITEAVCTLRAHGTPTSADSGVTLLQFQITLTYFPKENTPTVQITRRVKRASTPNTIVFKMI